MGEGTALRSLVRAWGVQPVYTDATGRRRAAPAESVLSVLRLLGAPLQRAADAPGALREWTADRWSRALEPVTVAWEGDGATVGLRLPARELPRRLGCCLELEDGEPLQQRFRADELPSRGEAVIDGERFVELELPLGTGLPCGYHRLTVETARRSFECSVISAPRAAHGAPPGRERCWGVFLPLHALHGERSWGAGSYADLSRLVDWTADRGGRIVGTLPLLPTFLDEPFGPSPYLPASRLMWSELHVSMEELPGTGPSGAVQPPVAGFGRRLSRLRRATQVDHRGQLALQRVVLERLSAELCHRPSPEHDRFRAFLRAHPRVVEYARFRAVGERAGRPWPEWPARLREGGLRSSDYDAAAETYHAFAQWQAAEQLEAAAARARDRGVRLYLDLPVGVHRAGYDVWREPGLFARGASAGAPPDDFFTRGQSWCFPPLVPERSRAQAHRYFAECLRHHMRTAGILRIDHVMSLHRLFWIPEGRGADEGVYVRYPAEELYAILCLESRRSGCTVVGEDLGTVPREVRPAMRRHGLRRTFVLQYGRGANPRRPLESMKIEGMASLHTHDMPTFAAFWRGLDIGSRLRRGELTPAAARRERAARGRLRAAWERDLRRGGWLTANKPGTPQALAACLALLGGSAAETVLVDLEDLWGETEPQNVPGTTSEHPNWRRRARHSLEELAALPRVQRLLSDLHARRRGETG